MTYSRPALSELLPLQRKFKMLTLKTIMSQIWVGDWFVTVDLKDAYFHIQVIWWHRKFLQFAFGGKAYQYKVLPFGLALALRTFTKCMNAPLAPLRFQGIRVLNYRHDLALFHCMVWNGTVQYGSLLGGFPLGTVPATWYFFSTTLAEVPSDPYRYQNVTCKLCWSLIGRIELSLLRHWTCDMRPIDPLDLNQHSQRKIGRNFCLNKLTFLYQPKNVCFIVCWGNTDVPLVDSWGADPARAWWRDAEGKRLMYILLNLLYFQSMSSVYIFNFVSVFCFN